MEFRKFGNNYVLRLDKPEEVVATLQEFCQEQRDYFRLDYRNWGS